MEVFSREGTAERLRQGLHGGEEVEVGEEGARRHRRPDRGERPKEEGHAELIE